MQGGVGSLSKGRQPPAVQPARVCDPTLMSTHPHPCSPAPPRSHVFETAHDDRERAQEKGALDTQARAVAELLESLRRQQRGSGGGVGGAGGGGGSGGGGGGA